MPKKVCPNGHVYDPSIYGDQCPMCPSGANSAPISSGTQIDDMPGPDPFATRPAHQQPFDGHTHISNPAQGMVPPFNPMPGPTPNVTGPTQLRPQDREPMAPQQPQATGGHTMIRRPGAARGGATPAAGGRKLVGFLVTYNRDPMGKAYNLYEGRNYVGRDASCDIAVPDDSQMSGRHMSILYRNVDNKFKFRDEQSSNGTFVNKELLDDGELQNYDILRVGSTLFIFIAIPKIG